MIKDIDLIVFCLLIVMSVTLIDDEAGQRWCDTYEFCEEEEQNHDH